ncbi:MAG: transcription termination factor Rho, partial [Lysobacteraceae bacterium]
MSDNTPETGDAGAPAEKRARKPRVAKTAPADAPASAPDPVAAPPSAPAPAAPAAPRNESQQPPAAANPPTLSQ